MTQVERAGCMGHAELDRWLAKDAANCCLLDFSDSDAFLQASIPSIWDPISTSGEDVMSYLSDVNVCSDANAADMFNVIGIHDNVKQLYDYSCSDSEVDDSDTVSSNPDDFIDLAASFLVESDASGAAVEDGQEKVAADFPVERPRNRRKKEIMLGEADEAPVKIVRPFKRQRMVGPIINILDNPQQNQYFVTDPTAQLMAPEENHCAPQWNHDNFLTPYAAIDAFCNDEEVESPRSDATEKELSMPLHNSQLANTEPKLDQARDAEAESDESSYVRVR